MTLNSVLLQGLRRGVFLMSEAPLYATRMNNPVFLPIAYRSILRIIHLGGIQEIGDHTALVVTTFLKW